MGFIIKKVEIKKFAQIIAELTYELEKTCNKKEAFFCNSKGLSPMEFRCLRYLVNNDFPLVKDLAKELRVTPPRITTILNKLEEKNIIERKIDASDRRVIKVSLNRYGNDFAKKICSEYIEFHEKILETMDKDKLSPLLENLNGFHQTITNFLDNNH